MPKTIVQSYLWGFAGRCEEAVEFYKSSIGAQVEMLMRYKDSPEPCPGGLPSGWENKVMHCSFRVGETTVMASDGRGPDEEAFKGVSLALSLPTEAEVDRAFAALSDGGSVTMPLDRTFWSPKFGMLTDRFGLNWMVSVTNPNT